MMVWVVNGNLQNYMPAKLVHRLATVDRNLGSKTLQYNQVITYSTLWLILLNDGSVSEFIYLSYRNHRYCIF